MRLKRICHLVRTCLTLLLLSHLPRTASTSSSSFTLPSTTTPEHALQSGQHDNLQETPSASSTSPRSQSKSNAIKNDSGVKTDRVTETRAKHPPHIQGASQAKVLVLDVSSARKPMRRTMSKRWIKAGRRTRRCARFGKWTSKASQCAALENGSLRAESLWYSGCGCAANVDQASEDEGC